MTCSSCMPFHPPGLSPLTASRHPARQPLMHRVNAAQTHTPVYLAWIKKISYVAYGYSGLVKNEFEDLRIHTTQVTCQPALFNARTIEPAVGTAWIWQGST